MKNFIAVAVAILTLASGATVANFSAISAADAKAAPKYDCTKKGNANKAACQSAAVAPSATPTAATPAAVPAKKPSLMSGFMHPAAKPQSSPATSTMATSSGTAAPSGGHPICKKGKPCGNSCIAMAKTCHKS